MRINTNIAALNSHRMLQNSSISSSKNLEKLSSGKRINRASDDAAGLAISEKMNAQIRGLKMASRNAMDGVSLVQTAEGAMGEVHAMLQRMRELSVQAANGTMSTEDRKAIQDEINQLTSEVNRIGNGTEFNKLNILQGNQGPNSNTIVGKMSTGEPAEVISNQLNAPLEKLDDKELKFEINGNVSIINLQGFTGTTSVPPSTLTLDDLVERIQDGIKDYANVFLNGQSEIFIRTKESGGNQGIKVLGSAAIEIFGLELNTIGKSENPANYATGYFYFDDLPEPNSSITIGDKKIDFFNSDILPYSGTNFAIDLKSMTSGADIVTALVNLKIDGISMSPGDEIDITNEPDPIANYPGFPTTLNDNKNPRELRVISHNRGFIGNTVALEGTLKEFNINLQVGANAGQGFRLEVGDTRAMALKISSDKPTGNPGVPGASYVKIPNVTNGISAASVEYSLDVMDEKLASAAIEVFNNAIINVASERSKLGAIQNRLEKTIANLDNTAENLTAARSRIEDTDMALEMSEFTKFNILQQAGTAMLAQANQQPQMMLQLLNS